MGTFKETENVKYIDLSHAIVDGTVRFPGDPPASIVTYLDRESVLKQNGGGPNSGAEINKITIVSTSGTYIDFLCNRS